MCTAESVERAPKSYMIHCAHTKDLSLCQPCVLVQKTMLHTEFSYAAASQSEWVPCLKSCSATHASTTSWLEVASTASRLRRLMAIVPPDSACCSFKAAA